MSWLQRWRQRQKELAQGVDADLIHDNNRLLGLAFGLIALGVLLFFLSDRLDLGDTLHTVAVLAGGVFFIVGGIMAQWAWRVRMFLLSPDPEKPPSILKK